MIIPSLLWTDFYKFTMAQVVLHQAADAWTKFKFKCRNGTALPFEEESANKTFVEDIQEEINALCKLRISKEELDYLRNISFFKPDYIEYLRLLQLNPNYISVGIEDGRLSITIEGPWISTIWFEVPVLLIVSTLYNKYRPESKIRFGFDINKVCKGRLEDKVDWLKTNLHPESPFAFADFGTRRAWSPDWHRIVARYLKERVPKWFVGTSNVYLAKELDLKPIGTMAHEYVQGWQQLGPRLVDSQKAALQAWADEYRGELGIALTDTVGMNAFLRDFDRYFALLFDGCRHDSGDPVGWAEKLIHHYQSMRIDSRTKTAVWSDGLNFQVAVRLFNMFHQNIRCSFGIGTWLTNDVGLDPLQLVIKMVECNHKPVAKISDSKGKGMCEDDEFLSYLSKVFEIER